MRNRSLALEVDLAARADREPIDPPVRACWPGDEPQMGSEAASEGLLGRVVTLQDSTDKLQIHRAHHAAFSLRGMSRSWRSVTPASAHSRM
jgi:hypothetical protein